MALFSGKGIFKLFLILVLAGVGVSLYFSKDIRKAVDEWKNKGANEARVSLPQQDQKSAGNTAGQVGLAPESFGGLFGSGQIPGQAPGQPLGQGSEQGMGQGTDQISGGPNSLLGEIGGDIPEISGLTGLNATSQEATPQTQAQTPEGTTDGEGSAGGASQQLQGGIAVTTESGQQAQVGGVAPPVHEDSVVSKRIVDDMARLLVNSYYPGGTRPGALDNKGYVTINLRTINVHYGAEGSGYFKKSRAEALHYIMAPSMLEALYRLYVNDFIGSMTLIAATEERELRGGARALTPAEQRDMFNHYATLSAGLAGVFEACAASPAIAEKLDNYYKAAVDVGAKNGIFMEASQAREDARKSKSPDLVVGAENAYAKAAKDYQDSVKERESLRDTLLSALKRYPRVRNLDDNNVIYTAAWINRRLADGSADNGAIATASRVFDNLSSRFKAAGEK